MAYAIRLMEPYPLGQLRSAIEEKVEGSRFTIGEIYVNSPSKRARKYMGGYITLHGIRLRELKPYCGNHPGPCLIDRPHRQSRCLEGLDWVEFNDLINDVLDRLCVNAEVASSQCSIRTGLKRRVNYRMEKVRLDKVYEFYRWAKVGLSQDYQDWCGQLAPRSGYPEGTPGLLSA